MKMVNYLVGNSRNLEKLFVAYNFPRCDLILTSPPYFNIKNYENVQGQIGQHQTYDEYLDDLASIFQQCYRVSQEDATLWIVLDTIRKNGNLIPLPFDLDKRLKQLFGTDTWTLRDVVIWDKYKNVPWHQKGHFKNRFEYILFYSKKKKYKYNIDRVRQITDYKKWWLTYPERYNLNGSPPTNIWQYTIPIRGWGNGRQNHFCPFPFPLVERILTLCSDEGDLLLDPFAGSGSVLAIAKVMNRQAIGIDINQDYRHNFYNEVMLGAEKYWAARSKELKDITADIKKFTNINSQLRKIKACLRLAEIIRSELPYEGRFVAINDGPASSQKVQFCVVTRLPTTVRNKLCHVDTCVIDLSREFKVRIVVNVLTEKGLAKTYPRIRQLFGYHKDRIYRYNRVVSVNHFSNGNLSADTLYSNIKLRLNRSLSTTKNI